MLPWTGRAEANACQAGWVGCLSRRPERHRSAPTARREVWCRCRTDGVATGSRSATQPTTCVRWSAAHAPTARRAVPPYDGDRSGTGCPGRPLPPVPPIRRRRQLGPGAGRRHRPVWANGPWGSTYDHGLAHPIRLGGRPSPAHDRPRLGQRRPHGRVLPRRRPGDRPRAPPRRPRPTPAPPWSRWPAPSAAWPVPAWSTRLVNHGGPGARRAGASPWPPTSPSPSGRWRCSAAGCRPGLRVFLLTLAVADDIGSVVVLAVFYSSRTSHRPWSGPGRWPWPRAVARRRSGPPPPWCWPAAWCCGCCWPPAGWSRPWPAWWPACWSRPSGRAPRPDPADASSDGSPRGRPSSSSRCSPWPTQESPSTPGCWRRPGPRRCSSGWPLARVVGKLGGITVACFVVVRLGLGRLPERVRWRHVAGGAAVAGIGFTVPLLIAEQAFVHRPTPGGRRRVGLFAGSVVAFAVGAAAWCWSGHAPGSTGGPRPTTGGPMRSPSSRGDR